MLHIMNILYICVEECGHLTKHTSVFYVESPLNSNAGYVSSICFFG